MSISHWGIFPGWYVLGADCDRAFWNDVEWGYFCSVVLP